MSKPREFAHLIRNKFGSADNINQIRAVEHIASSMAPEDAFAISPAPANNMSAGNSNSLPGHGATSQVKVKSTEFSKHITLFFFIGNWNIRYRSRHQSRFRWW